MESPFTDLVDKEFVSKALVEQKKSTTAVKLDVLNKKMNGSSKTIKQIIRKSNIPINHVIRKQLWPRLINKIYSTSITVNDNAVEAVSTSTQNTSFDNHSALTGFEIADRRLQMTYNLNPHGRSALLLLLHEVSLIHPEIVYAPQTWPILALFLHYHSPPAALACILALLDQPGLLVQSKTEWRNHCLALEYLGKHGFAGNKAFTKFKNKQLNFLSSQNAKNLTNNGTKNQLVKTDEEEDTLISHSDPRYQLGCWMIVLWMLPFEHLVHLMDCFLIEGPKAFYRAGLVIWHRASLKITSDSNIPTHLKLAASNFQPKTSFLNTIFAIHHFSHTDMEKALSKALKKQPHQPGLDFVDSLVVPCTLPGHRTYTAFDNVKAELTAKGRSSLRTIASPTRTNTPSSIATAQEISFLIANLTDENLVQTCTPILIFNSETDGVSLQTLFRLSETHYKSTNRPETIILVRTLSGKCLIGAFCSSIWQPGSEFNFFGNGSCYLFRLRPSPPQIYKWKDNGENGNDRFQRATTDFIEIGGGLDSGPGGLRINSNLSDGESGATETFSSHCLINTEEDQLFLNKSQKNSFCTFKISTVELIGFKPINV